MVALAKEWHKKVGVCEDIHSCDCCGVRDFQQVKEVEVTELGLPCRGVTPPFRVQG